MVERLSCKQLMGVRFPWRAHILKIVFMKIYLSSDLHLGHANIKKYCNRPDNFEDLIYDGLKILQPEDLYICLGDISMGRHSGIHTSLRQAIPCKSILVKGNHDNEKNSWYLNYWDFVCYTFSDTYFNRKILFSHCPQTYDLDKYDLNIHGHLHNNRREGSWENFKFNDRIYKLISPEYLNYKPILLEEIL